MILTDLQPYTEERVWTAEDIPVLTARLTVPDPPVADDRISRRIRRYYRLQLRACLRRCEAFLFPRAEADFRAALAAGTLLPPCRAELDYEITCREGALLSLCVRLRETAPQGGCRLACWGDTWDLTDGFPVPLTAFFPDRSGWKRELLAHAAEELRRQEAQGLLCPRSDAQRALRRHFNPRSYYLTPEGLVFFYPQGTLAPEGAGILTFTVPRRQSEPAAPAEKKAAPPC